jgi:transketolase
MQLRDQPVSLVLSRQALPTLDRSRYASAAGVARGAYVLADAADGRPDLLLLASGSEVALCIAAYEQLTIEGVKVRVVSMPSWDLFERQGEAYREHVLPEAVTARVSVEAAAALGWDRYVGRHGAIIAMRSYGLSAPGKVVKGRTSPRKRGPEWRCPRPRHVVSYLARRSLHPVPNRRNRYALAAWTVLKAQRGPERPPRSTFPDS